MKKYSKQGTSMIKSLEKEIEIIELSDKIIEARLEKGIDRIPCDILVVIGEIKKLQHLDIPSIYSVLVWDRKPGAIWEENLQSLDFPGSKYEKVITEEKS